MGAFSSVMYNKARECLRHFAGDFFTFNNHDVAWINRAY